MFDSKQKIITSILELEAKKVFDDLNINDFMKDVNSVEEKFEFWDNAVFLSIFGLLWTSSFVLFNWVGACTLGFVLSGIFAGMVILGLDSFNYKTEHFLYNFIPSIRKKMPYLKDRYKRLQSFLDNNENLFPILHLFEDIISQEEKDEEKKSLSKIFEDFQLAINNNKNYTTGYLFVKLYKKYITKKDLHQKYINQNVKKEEYVAYKDSILKKINIEDAPLIESKIIVEKEMEVNSLKEHL